MAVWGCGYIGFSTMANFAANGVRCLGIDVSEDIVRNVNSGKMPVPNLEYWLGFDTAPLSRKGLIRATSDWREAGDNSICAHMIAVPTEKEDKPWDGALEDVARKITEIAAKNRPLVIVESTLTPNKTDNLLIPAFESAGLRVGHDILLGVAPRRDWFISPDKNLRNLPRIVGGTTPETTQQIIDLLSIICEKLLAAPDHRHAEIVKSVENAYRHVEITLANQLSLAYPDLNMVEVLRLVGTKWNMNIYHPSFGSGGYCIPLASKYVLSGATRPEELTLLRETIATDSSQPGRVAESLRRRGCERVGILGLGYKGDLKVHILSPTLKIVDGLKKWGIKVKVHDPYYSEKEIERIVGAQSFEFPQGLKEFDAVVVTAGHREYRSIPELELLLHLQRCRFVLDNVEEAWRAIDFASRGIEYKIAGGAGWLGDAQLSSKDSLATAAIGRDLR